MSDGENRASIQCPIGLFDDQEVRMAALTEAVNQASTPLEKAPWAEEIMAAADELLACEAYDESSRDCRLCRIRKSGWMRYIRVLRLRSAGYSGRFSRMKNPFKR